MKRKCDENVLLLAFASTITTMVCGTLQTTNANCIAKCSVNLVDSTVIEHELVLVPDDE